jgi:hypothetical protein
MTSDQLGVALAGTFISWTVTLEGIKIRRRCLVLLDLNRLADVRQGRRQDGDAGRRFPIAISVEEVPEPPITLAIGLNVGWSE